MTPRLSQSPHNMQRMERKCPTWPTRSPGGDFMNCAKALRVALAMHPNHHVQILSRPRCQRRLAKRLVWVMVPFLLSLSSLLSLSLLLSTNEKRTHLPFPSYLNFYQKLKIAHTHTHTYTYTQTDLLAHRTFCSGVQLRR